ncbi:hypothetical protein [Acinetobacter pittii]|uniref:hypothetical protein n=1 Tax=Acinetobacter pittii TaxID=48296 RepID=UPI00157FEAF1|nr:hypothetical protein [Acinetobacter pittii]NUF43096.1 hypothetical protein [Acinetobacter pittii]
MQTLNDVKKRLLINLQDYPEIALRYQNGDPIVVAMLQAQAGMIADQSTDIELAKIEPFIKSNVRTILADATNKGILPVATPCQHYIEVENKGTVALVIAAGRYFDDVQGRTWRFLQTVHANPGETVLVQAEQSEIRTIDYQTIFTEDFLQVDIDIQDELHLCGIRIYDDSGNNYKYRKRWLNCPPGEYAFNLKTDTLRKITAEFGDSLRCGNTVQANTVLSFEIIESEGQIDTSQLREASLQEIVNVEEAKAQLKFQTGGLIRAGTDPLSIEQLRLLSSYPTDEKDTVFLGNHDYAVRAAFMARCKYVTVWNEAVQDKYYKSSLDDINHLHLAFVAKNPDETELLAKDIKYFIGVTDSLYQDRVHVNEVEQRLFKIEINAKLAPVHDVETVREQITTLLISRYGRDSLSSSYFLADGFNTQELIDSIKKNITAFQDHISDFNVLAEDLTDNPIKPHQWTYIDKSSITINIKRTATTGANLWTG